MTDLLKNLDWGDNSAFMNLILSVRGNGNLTPGKNNSVILEYSLCMLRCSVMSDSFVAPWTIASQVPLSIGFPRQEYWSGLPFPSPGDVPNAGIEPTSPAWQVDS